MCKNNNSNYVASCCIYVDVHVVCINSLVQPLHKDVVFYLGRGWLCQTSRLDTT